MLLSFDALGPSSAFPQGSFNYLLSPEPQAFQAAAERANLIDEKILRFTYKERSLNDRRLANLLLEGSDHGRHSESSVTFELALTHQQIAARIGSVREVVSRASPAAIPDVKALREYVSE